MLPIIGFDYLDDDYLLRADDVINAINKFTNNILTIDILRQLEEKGLVKTTTTLGKDFSKLIHLELDSPEIASLELTITKISKREALKLLAIATGKEKPNQDTRSFALKVPKVERKTERFLFVNACIDTYTNGCNEFPPNAESLLKYCCIHKVEGYSDLEDTGGKDKVRKINFTGDKRTAIRWMMFIEILGKFKEAQS